MCNHLFVGPSAGEDEPDESLRQKWKGCTSLVCIFCCVIVDLFIRGDLLFLSHQFTGKKRLESEVATLPFTVYHPSGGFYLWPFLEPVLWDSICFMKKGQVGSLNLNWNCLDIVSAFGWVMQWGNGVVFSLPISLGDFFFQWWGGWGVGSFLFCFHCFCNFFVFSLCPWLSFVPQWLCI